MKTFEEFSVVQGEPDWHKLRRGIPTASEFSRIITPAKGDLSKGADTYAAELIAQSLGWNGGFQGTPDTERGVRLEKEAVRWLKMRHGIATREIGFARSLCGRYGASPDSMTSGAIGEPVEVKAPDTHTHIKWAIAGGLPEDHKCQCHGEMFVTGADRCHFVAYTDNPYLENLYVVVERDDFTERLGKAVLQFCERLDHLRRKLTGDEYEVLFPNPAPSERENP